MSSAAVSQSTSTPDAPKPAKSSLLALEFTAKYAALFIGLIYAVGFLIIAIHHSQFSIPEFDPWKPKIFSTGIVFCLFTGVPALAAFRTFGLFGLKRETPLKLNSSAENRGWLTVAVAAGFYAPGYGLSSLSGTFFGGFSDPKPWGFTLLIALGAVFVVIVLLMSKYFDRIPKTFTLLMCLSTAADMMLTFKFFDRKAFAVGLWCYCIGLLAVGASHILSSPEMRKRVEWESQIPILATILLLYGTHIYKHIVPYFGGGVPTPTTMYFSSKIPFSGTDSADVQLLEQTSDGYFVLRPGDEKHAYFLRRDLVSAIHFGVPEPKQQK